MCCPDDVEYERTQLPTDPEYDLILSPWDDNEQPLVRGDDGLHRWPDSHHPAEMVAVLQQYVGALQKDDRDLIIIETGVGLGYLTRRLAQLMRPEHDLYWCYEPDPTQRMQLSIRDFWLKNLSTCLKDYPTPEHNEMEIADLVIVDGGWPLNAAEFYLWLDRRKTDSLLVINNARPEEPSFQAMGYAIYGDVDRFRTIYSSMFERSATVV